MENITGAEVCISNTEDDGNLQDKVTLEDKMELEVKVTDLEARSRH